ncbi:ImmA/IrrE family metallo-endopeptidase [Mesobacillus subterraneus]|uniref:ImmA/IrrE family metallo-endopeptidase n=1 Tax=Mesobacillus subterraneus TaxID=285983 RepID=UPI00273EB21B|nr:ImmA/IrrE family metallo-endopeptidase [Mesobacillus subterraneus]WLR54319.1 ImmA/IrrE family metallo-endopeptidase [Mesobacillus subterraneus]
MILKDFLIKGTKDTYEELSEEIFNKQKVNHPNSIDLYSLCDSFGMKVTLANSDIKMDHSIASKKERRGLILLEKNKSEIEERQLLAEEFSHLYLHQKNQLFMGTSELNKMENQAFKLASNILIPTKWLLNIEVYPSLNQKFILAEDVAQQFNVLPEFAYKRLKYLNENYLFDKSSTGILYNMPMFDMLPEQIFVVLNKKENFILN